MRKKHNVRNIFVIGALLILAGCAETTEETMETVEDMAPIEQAEENPSEAETSNVEEEETTTSEEFPSPERVEFTSDVETQYTTSLNQDILDAHDAIHQEIISEYEAGNFTFENPLIHIDPYGRSPLSALISFETEEPLKITATVIGETADTTISHTYAVQEQDIHLPILGLYPNRDNEVLLRAETEEGEIRETKLTLTTEALPSDLLDFTVETANVEKMAEGLTFIQPSYYPTAVDHHGDVRWFSPVKTYNQLSRLENGNMLLATLEEGRDDYDHLTEMNMLGKVEQSITIDMEHVLDSPPLHHDTIVLPNGNYLALLHDGSEHYVEDEMAELDRETGEVVHRINFKDVFPDEVYEHYTGRNEEVGDWAHINTVYLLEDEGALLLSLRNQDAILKMTYPEPEIVWLLGYPENWPEELEEYVLEPAREDMVYHAGPHAVEAMPDQDGRDETMDIMLFDNNRVYTRGNEDLSEAYSRGVQFRVNETEGTVDEIWSYGEERGTDFYSRIVGDADYLPYTETVLLTSGHVLDEIAFQRNSIIVEVTKTENPEVVFELWYGPAGGDEYYQTYRAERMPLYPEQ